MSVPLGEPVLATPFGFPFRAPKGIARWIKFNGGKTRPHILVLDNTPISWSRKSSDPVKAGVQDQQLPLRPRMHRAQGGYGQARSIEGLRKPACMGVRRAATAELEIAKVDASGQLLQRRCHMGIAREIPVDVVAQHQR